MRPFRTRFRCAYAYRLKLATKTNSLTHYTKGTPSPRCPKTPKAPTACRHPVSGTVSPRSSRCFSPFPHGTGSLSVTEEYLGLEGGPPMFRQDGSCPALLKDLRSGFPYGAVTRCGAPFQTLPVPKTQATGLVRFRSPLLAESRLMSFPPATEMFQFAGFASPPYGFRRRYPSQGGLPHSEIPGSTIARISPGLFAACHVLHRLSVPRHPPDALTLRLSATPNGKDHSDIGLPISQITTNRCDKLSLLRRHFVTGAHLPPAQHVPIGRTPRPLTVSRYGHTYSLLYDDQSTACSGGQMVDQKQFQTLRRVIRSASRRLRCKRLSALPQPDTHRGESDAFTGSGGDRDRTDDPLLAKQVLSQLSYTPGLAKQRRPAG